MNGRDWWWDTQDQLPARARVVPFIWASDKAHLTIYSADQNFWLLYVTIGNIRIDICR